MKEINYNERIENDILMIGCYFRSIINNIECKRGQHHFDGWSATNGKRVCSKCNLEMPESGRGEKNYKSWEDYKSEQKNRYKHFLD